MSARAAATLAALLSMSTFGASCLSPGSIACSDGRICPAGSRCDLVHHTCNTPTEIAACIGIPEGGACTLVQTQGTCQNGVCQPFHCGDGIRNGGEACEGNDLGGQTCATLHYYGQTTGLACNSDCTLNTNGCLGYCGDGIANGPEQCDGQPPDWGKDSCLKHGFDRGLLACSETCAVSVAGCSKIGGEGDGSVAGAGSGWQIIPDAPADFYAMSVWGAGPNDVYAMGPGTVWHWDGTRWSNITSAVSNGAAQLRAIGGSGPSNVLIVGSGEGGGVVVSRGDGTTWTRETLSPTGFASAVWVNGPTEAYVVGSAVWTWDGSRWSALGATDGGLGVWASGPDDVFAVGGPNGIRHWDGSKWSQQASPWTFYKRVWGTGPKDVFALASPGVAHWDGTSWTALTGDVTSAIAISGTSPDDIVAVGGGLILHFDGRTWTRDFSDSGNSFTDVWVGAGAGYVVGGSRVLSLVPDRWGAGSFGGTPPVLNGVWGDGAGKVYAVGEAGTLARSDGAGWTTTALDTTLPMRAVWGNGANDVLAVGDNRLGDTAPNLAHWDGTRWSRPAGMPTLAPSQKLRGVWSSGPTDIYLVGETGSRGLVLHSDGTSWSELLGVFAGPPVDFNTDFAAGLNAGYGPPLQGVFGTTRDNMWVFGRSWLSRWDGFGWSRSYVSPPGNATGLFATRTQRFVVTDAGALADLGEPSIYNLTHGPLRAIAGTGGDVFAAGDGVLLHGRAGRWEEIALPVAGEVRGLWATPSRLTLVGTMGELHLDRHSVTCVAPEKNCDDGWDNDCDGLQDVADPDCAGKVTEQCANWIDDDGDGASDCGDPDCDSFPSCRWP